MIGSGLKKLAAEHNMQVARGVAYGALHGYAATLSEGAGTKNVIFTAKFPDAQKLDELQAALEKRNLDKEFRVQELTFFDDGIMIIFLDNPGTMKRLLAFIDWFCPMLDTAGATKANICTECGMEIAAGGKWKLIDGVAFHLHEGCARQVVHKIETETDQARQADTGSYGKGLIGALLGALLGAIVWALVWSIGYVAAIVGFLIGWLADKGYHMLHGKQGKGRVVILIVAILIGVLLGTFGGEAMAVGELIADGSIPDAVYGDIPFLIIYLLAGDSAYLTSMLGNVGLGLLFAFLGTFVLLHRAKKEVSDTKIEDLE